MTNLSNSSTAALLLKLQVKARSLNFVDSAKLRVSSPRQACRNAFAETRNL